MIHKNEAPEVTQDALRSFGKFWTEIREGGMPDNRPLHRLLRKIYVKAYFEGSLATSIDNAREKFNELNNAIDELHEITEGLKQ